MTSYKAMRDRKQSPNPMQVTIKKVASANGRAWLTQAYKIFRQSMGVWLGIASFLTLLQLIPVVSQLASLFIPFAIGGLMLGCQKQAQGQAMKFDHIFGGIKQDSRQLITLSLSYGLMSLAVMLITFMLMQSLGLDMSKILPEDLQKMTPMQLTQWIETADPQVVYSIISSAVNRPSHSADFNDAGFDGTLVCTRAGGVQKTVCVKSFKP
ncbi:MAG: hypothetical protein Q9M92_00805 [Enterobacterales bacterium]|nr:hypothetical protein [Enterobacterales bacterium]